MTTPPFGTVSRGTLRTEDLIEAFAYALGETPHQLQVEAGVWLATPEDERDEDAGCYILEDLQDALDNIAPPYGYFGSHEGDGADFGFWPDWGAIEEAEYCGELVRVSDLADLSDDPPANVPDALVVNDHGNATLYYYDHARAAWVETWSIV